MRNAPPHLQLPHPGMRWCLVLIIPRITPDRPMRKTDQALNASDDTRREQSQLRTTLLSTIVCKLTDLGGTYSLMLDKHAGVAKFVLADDALSTLPNWDNLRLLHSAVLGQHPPDRLRMRLQRYSPLRTHRRLLTPKRSR
jgi:hypothetical protein